MKRKPFFMALVLASATLLVTSGFLFRQNQIYRIENRELILQNDSLIAVTIELKRLIDASVTGPPVHEKGALSISITKK